MSRFAVLLIVLTTFALAGALQSPAAGAQDNSSAGKARATGADKKSDQAVQKELAALEGTWVAIDWLEDGRKEENEIGEKLVISGTKVTFVNRDGKPKGEGTLKLNVTKQPKWIDLARSKGSGVVGVGIYELDGDRLRICLGGEDRPQAFQSTRKGGEALITLKRQKP
jgi:uncharacterized protein (TIGR03067 family)